MENPSAHIVPPRLYGRSKGRPLSPYQQKLMDELYPSLSALEHIGRINHEDVFFEIGFGGGEHLLRLAKQNPEALIIGAEPFLNGVAKTVRGIRHDKLENVLLHNGDARDVMERMPKASVQRLYILFPDPWPKTRHNKRRIINQDFLDKVHALLRPGGVLYFASDIIDYVDWAMTRLKRHGGFKFETDQAGNWRLPYPDWPGTRYEEKAIKAGRPCHYLQFVRN